MSHDRIRTFNLAAGHCTIFWHGKVYAVEKPEPIDAKTALPVFPQPFKAFLQRNTQHFVSMKYLQGRNCCLPGELSFFGQKTAQPTQRAEYSARLEKCCASLSCYDTKACTRSATVRKKE